MHTSRSRGRTALPKSITTPRFKLKETTSFIVLLTKMRSSFLPRTRTRSTSSKSRTLTCSNTQLKAAFDRYGVDGLVNPSDLGTLIRSLGGNPTQAEVSEIIRKEKLTAPFGFQRFVDLMAKHLREDMAVDRYLRQAFKVIDQDSDGFITVSDLQQLLTTVGERLELREFNEWIQGVGVGPDDIVRFEDVIAPLIPTASN